MAPADPPDAPIRRFSQARRLSIIWGGLTAAFLAGWIAGLVWFAETLPRTLNQITTETGAMGATDAVVVLTGGAGRIEVAIDLLAKRRAKKLFVSGVYRGVDVTQILNLVKKQGPELECCMALGHAADNTRGNARESAQWMKKQGFQSLRLVTANYHMRRSLLEFRRMMPNARIIPHPVFPPEFKARGWWRWPGTLKLLISEYIKYLIALIRLW